MINTFDGIDTSDGIDALGGFVAFIESGDLVPGVFADDLTVDFNVPSWRFAVRGATAFAAQRGPGRWRVVVDRVESTGTGFAVELSHEHGGEYYRTLSLVTVDGGRITDVLHYCTGNWDAATRAAYAGEGG